MLPGIVGETYQMALPNLPQMATSLLPSCPFVPGPMITDLRLFVGRKDELRFLTTHMSGVQPVSINIVGERRIGKSSLLYHFFQVWGNHVQNVHNYIVILLSLQNANFQTRNGFYHDVLKGFQSQASIEGRNDLDVILNISSFDDASFTQVLEQLKQKDVLPVLCLDEFETLLKYKDQFNDSFFDHLRSLMNNNILMLIVSSHKKLDEYSNKNSLTSTFFNLGLVLNLGELTEQEAIELVRLPASVVSGSQAALSIEEQRQARLLGGKNPYRLQLACSFICQARQQGKTLDWAKKQFASEKQRVSQPQPSKLKAPWLVPLRILFVDFPMWLGKVSKRIGQHANNISTWLTGILIIVIVVLVVLGIINYSEIIAWFKTLGG